jgi:Transposase DDE domain
MRPRHYTLTAAYVHTLARNHAQHYLRLADHGPKTTAGVLFTILFWAAARLASLAAACASLRKAPSDQAVRDALLATLPDFHELQRRLHRALQGGLPKTLGRRRGVHLALDLVLIPYYGLPEDDADELYRGAEKAGTRSFHAYATAYVIVKGCRYTLALRAVHHSDPWDEVVRDLLRQVRKTGVRIRLVLLDRGFYSVEVVRYLQAARYPFVMPVIRRGKRPNHPDGPSGTWAFSNWRRSGWSQYTLADRHHRRRATVTICVCRFQQEAATVCGRQRAGGWRVWVYALWGLQPSRTAWVRETYRQRFGIESSYRQLHQARVRTTARSPLLRLLFVGLALVLRNVYVRLHWEVLAYKRRGGRVVDLNQLPLQALLNWLATVAETLFGLNTERKVARPLVNTV